MLALPSTVREMDKAWASCGLDWRGAWDPPIALQPADALDPVTTAVEPKHTDPAAPQSKASPPAMETAMTRVTTSVEKPKATETPDAIGSLRQSSLRSDGISLSTYPQASDASNKLQPTETYQLFQGGTWSAKAGGRSRSRGDAATFALSELSDPVDGGSKSFNPGVAVSEGHDRSGPSSSPTNALEVMSEALKTLGRSSAVPFPSSKTSSESFGPKELATVSSKTTVSSQVPAGTDGAQTESVYRTNDPSITPGDLVADSTLMQPVTTLSAPESQSMILFSMDGSIHSASTYKGDGFQISSRTLTSGDPETIGDHVLSATARGSYEHTQFSLVSSTQTSDTVVSMSLEASVVAISETSKGAWLMDGHTLTPGGSALVLGSHTVSVGTDGLLRDGTTLSGPAPSSKATSSSEESSPGSRLPAVTTAHDASQHSSSIGQENSAQNRQSSTSTTSSAGQAHTGYYLTFSLCATVFSLIALPYI